MQKHYLHANDLHQWDEGEEEEQQGVMG